MTKNQRLQNLEKQVNVSEAVQLEFVFIPKDHPGFDEYLDNYQKKLNKKPPPNQKVTSVTIGGISEGDI